MTTITPIAAFHDNYIWMIVHPEKSLATVVDPGAAQPVLDALAHKQLKLSAILITHHHHDHTGGVHELLSHYSVPVYGPAQEHTPATHPCQQDDRLVLPDTDFHFDVLDTPGHTKGHISYVGLGGVFCGDTLFAAGCGRLFEGTAAQLFHSLQKLAALPTNTNVYCAHEYTLANLAFAKTVEPNNTDILNRIRETEKQRQQNLPSLPSTIAMELKTNPFLRCHINTVQHAAEQQSGKKLTTPVDVFAALRQWKDGF